MIGGGSIYEQYADKDYDHIKEAMITILKYIDVHPKATRREVSNAIHGKRNNYCFALVRKLENKG